MQATATIFLTNIHPASTWKLPMMESPQLCKADCSGASLSLQLGNSNCNYLNTWSFNWLVLVPPSGVTDIKPLHLLYDTTSGSWCLPLIHSFPRWTHQVLLNHSLQDLLSRCLTTSVALLWTHSNILKHSAPNWTWCSKGHLTASSSQYSGTIASHTLDPAKAAQHVLLVCF